jgi:hypothetical protein
MTQPTDLHGLLDQLLMREPLDAVRLLGDELADISWQDRDESQISAIVADFLPFLTRLAGRIRTDLRQSSLPLSDKGRLRIEALLRLYRYAQLMLNLKLTSLCEREDDDLGHEYLVRTHQDRVDWAIRTIMDCYLSYVDVPKALYVDLHQLVDLARNELQDDQPVGWQSIYQHYVAILTLAVVNPYGLTREGMEDSYACLVQVGGAIELVHDQPTPTSRFIDLTGKIMPHLALTTRTSSLTESGIFLDLGSLYQPETTAGLSPVCRSQVYQLLEHLKFFFVGRGEREGQPSSLGQGKQRTSLITLGFLSVHHRLERLSQQEGHEISPIALAGLDWEGLEQPIRGKVAPISGVAAFKMDIQSQRSQDEMDWDTGFGTGRKDVGRPLSLNEPGTWDVVNFSASGFRFHWRLSSSSHAAVDDLLLAEWPEQKQPEPELVIGIVRWVRHMDAEHKTIDMGVQRFSGTVFASYARDYRAGDTRWSKSWPVIVQLDEQSMPVRIILATALAVEAQELLVMQEETEVRLRLGSVSQTGQDFLMMEAHRVDA